MKSRWLLNLALLLVVAGIVLFLDLRPSEQVEQHADKSYPVSDVAPSAISKISIEFPAKAPLVLERRDGNWFLAQPYPARAGKNVVYHVLSILSASSPQKFAADNLSRFGLDAPVLRLRLDAEEISFGTYNPVSGLQYIAYRDAVYMVSNRYSEVAGTQVVEFLDKNPLAPSETIAGFDFSRLEQWEPTGLRVDLQNGKWQVSIPAAKPKQQDLNEWFAEIWGNATATSVEPYQPDRNTTYPSFEVKLPDGKRVHFDKLQESPELLLARPDEGLLYHYPMDQGFAMLNPPVGFKPQ